MSNGPARALLESLQPLPDVQPLVLLQLGPDFFLYRKFFSNVSSAPTQTGSNLLVSIFQDAYVYHKISSAVLRSFPDHCHDYA